MSVTRIEVGQVWRRKKSGKLIVIDSGGHQDWDDWKWKGHDYTGRGESFGVYIRRNYELVAEVPAAEKGTDHE